MVHSRFPELIHFLTGEVYTYFFFFFGIDHKMWLVGSQFLDQGLNQSPGSESLES